MTQDVAHSIVGAIPLPAVLVRRDERVEAANALALNMFGGGLVGRHFVTALRHPSLLDAVEQTLTSGAPGKVRYERRGAAGQDRTYLVSMQPVTLTRGAGVLVCFEDVTPLQEAGQMRRDFVANVSHELRTPLTAVMGFIETIRGPARNDQAAQDRFLQIMEAECTRMNRLVEDLLSLSKVEANRRIRPTEHVDPAVVLHAVARSLQGFAEQAQSAITLDIEAAGNFVEADADQLRQVFVNLIENALKYGGQGNDVRVRLSGVQDIPKLRRPGFTITVSDSGPGIEATHIPRLTERFYRVDTGRSREMGGTGLGLAIVKHIVNRHRGRMTIESMVGSGTTVTLYLPAADAG